MSTPTVTRTKLTAQMVHVLGELLGKARELRAKQLVIAEAEQGAIAYFYVAGETSAANDLKRVAQAVIKAEWFAPLCETISSRAALWPTPNDVLWTTNPKCIPRIFCVARGGDVTFANYHTRRPIGAKSDQVVLDFLDWDLSSPFWQLVGLSGRNQLELEAALLKPRGIILVSASNHAHVVEGSAVCAAYRPDALLFRELSDYRSAAEALELAESKLVVIEVRSEDTVEMLVNVAGLLANDPTLCERLYDLLLVSFIYRRAKRVCGACARSSAIDPASLQRLPDVIRPLPGQTYMFGRGCEQCHHSAYHGTVEICSLLVVDEEIRRILKQRGSTSQLAVHAYRSGTRTLMESGLEKVYQGLTSFEGVFQVTQTVPEIFRSAIASCRAAEAREAPRDEEVKEALSTLGDDFFSEGGDHRRGFRLLVIEDDPEQLDILKLVFGKEGYDVQGAANGREALNLLANSRVDLVICDLMMPQMSGQQFVEALRKQERIKNLPVLVLTAVSNPDTEVDLLSVGADDYCCKDVNRKVLLKRVEKLLKKSNASLRQLLRA